MHLTILVILIYIIRVGAKLALVSDASKSTPNFVALAQILRVY